MSKRSNIININHYLHKKQKANLVDLLANNNKILKIMSEDISKRVKSSVLQYRQLDVLINLKSIFSSELPIYSVIAIYSLIKKTNYPDLSILSFSMYNTILNKLEFINIARSKTSISELVDHIQNMMSIQEKKILVTKLQLIKIRDSAMHHVDNIKELIEQCANVKEIPDEFIEAQ